MLTTCDRPKPHYHFKVSRMMVIPDDKIVTGPAYMKFGKVPTPLAVPFGLFPNAEGRQQRVCWSPPGAMTRTRATSC
jgi:hypothetical protein